MHQFWRESCKAARLERTDDALLLQRRAGYVVSRSIRPRTLVAAACGAAPTRIQEKDHSPDIVLRSESGTWFEIELRAIERGDAGKIIVAFDKTERLLAGEVVSDSIEINIRSSAATDCHVIPTTAVARYTLLDPPKNQDALR